MKSTKDIIPGAKKTFVIPTKLVKNTSPSAEKSVKITPGMHISWNKKALDLPSKKKTFTPKKKRGWKLFLPITSFFLVILLFAGVNVMAKKKALTDIGNKVEIEFSTALSALTSQNFPEAAESFSRVEQFITEAQTTLDPITKTTSFLDGSLGATADELLELAGEFANIAHKLSLLAPKIEKAPEILLTGDAVEIQSMLKDIHQEVNKIKNLLAIAEEKILEIEKLPLPTEWKNRIAQMKTRLPEANSAIAFAEDFFPAIDVIFGEEYPHTAAIFFQNTGEIRATGGFPGSLALLKSNDSQLEFIFRDIYYYAWKNGNFFDPPRGFERMAQRLNLRDSNSFFHFPHSAEQMRMMLERSGGPTAETIVTVSDDLFAEILRAVDPITIPGTNEELTGKNTSFLLSFFVEGKHFGKHTPKEAIAQILPELQEKAKALPPEKIYQIIRKAIQKKWILAHSTNPELQKVFVTLGIDGNVREPNMADYLAVVSANVGGNKSDHFITERLDVESVINLSGEVTNTLKIQRNHTWGVKQENLFEYLVEQYGNEYIPNPLLMDILGAGENHSYTEVYVPLGTKLLSANGVPLEKIETFDEAGKTVFAFRFPKAPAGQSRDISLQYVLPDTLNKTEEFDLYYQFQPGRDSVFVSRKILTESGIEVKKGSEASALLESDAIFEGEVEW